MKVIIQIPCYNEEATLGVTLSELPRYLPGADKVEWLIVDDGSTDDSFAVLKKLQETDPHSRIIRFRRNFGQTAAFSAGFAHARGRMIVTSDGDGQNDPDDIPALVAKLEDDQLDIVCGWRRNRPSG